jgi:GMP synthase (glutamine-hydrolysing)
MAPNARQGGATVLVVEHEAEAGPALLGDWIEEAGVRLRLCRPYAGDPVPERCEDNGLVVLGGAMGADDDEAVPWLPAVRALLEHSRDDGTPTLGICLGAQLLALATGGHVERGESGPEIGVCLLDLCDTADTDPLFGGLPLPVAAMQWHLDAITSLPPGAVLLARGDLYDVQAFRLGAQCWGVQFHPEVDHRVVKLWAEAEHSPALPPATVQAAVDEVGAREAELASTWRGLGTAFARLVADRWANA